MNQTQVHMLFAAFCGFAATLMLFLAYGFHQMDAGYLDMIAVVGAMLCLMGVREYVGMARDEA